MLERDAGSGTVSAGELLARLCPSSGRELREADAALGEMADRYDRAAAVNEPEHKAYPEFMAIVARICAKPSGRGRTATRASVNNLRD